MRQITKDIEMSIDGQPVGFRLFKLDAFSGVALLRLLMRLGEPPRAASGGNSVGGEVNRSKRAPQCGVASTEVAEEKSAPTILDLIASLSEEELRSVMTAVLNHVSVLLPAGPHPVMTGNEWGYPELEHDTPACMRLLLEGIAWSLSGFFGGGQSKGETAPADTSP